jgi:hypothetical protein
MDEKSSQVLPTLPHYHPESELATRPGYYPNLSDIQIDAITQLKEMITQEKLLLDDSEEHELLRLLRFLRARNFNVQSAFLMLKNDLEWRNQNNLTQLKTMSASEVLKCDLHQIFTYFPTWVQGFDRQCRPIAWRKFGKLEIWNVLKLVSMDSLLQFHSWEAEQALRLMKNQSIATGYNIETFVVVIDAAGWHLGLATSDAYTFIRGMSSTDSDHFPERLGKLIVINAPTALSFAWRIVSGFLDAVTLAKIKIYSKQSEWLPSLLEIMNEDQIPLQYGGTARDLTPEEALQSMDPPPISPPEHPLKEEVLTDSPSAIP